MNSTNPPKQKVTAFVERRLYLATKLNNYRDHNKGLARTNSEEKAVLRSSEVKRSFLGGSRKLLIFKETEKGDRALHAPALDIDKIHCELIPSSTDGNYHLYIDKPMPWKDYTKLLQVLYEVGIIEEEFYRMSLDAGMSFLRVRDKKYDP